MFTYQDAVLYVNRRMYRKRRVNGSPRPSTAAPEREDGPGRILASEPGTDGALRGVSAGGGTPSTSK